MTEQPTDRPDDALIERLRLALLPYTDSAEAAARAVLPIIADEDVWLPCTPELLTRFPRICHEQPGFDVRAVLNQRDDGTCDAHLHKVNLRTFLAAPVESTPCPHNSMRVFRRYRAPAQMKCLDCGKVLT